MLVYSAPVCTYALQPGMCHQICPDMCGTTWLKAQTETVKCNIAKVVRVPLLQTKLIRQIIAACGEYGQVACDPGGVALRLAILGSAC